MPLAAIFSKQAAAAAQQEIDPLGNVHASVAYQRHLATVLTRRALAIAAERARGNGSSPGADAS